MTKFIQKIQQFFSHLFGFSSPKDPKQQLVQGMMQALQMTEEKELACEEVFEVVDQYAELILRGEDGSEIMPLVHHHLAMCHECKDEFEMLLEMMQATAEPTAD